MGGNRTRLRLEPSDVGRLVRFPEPINECAGASELRFAVDQDQSCIHHAVSALILSYSAWLRKNRIARTLAMPASESAGTDRTEVARSERFELPTPRFEVW
jgi:hypothetical protein